MYYKVIACEIAFREICHLAANSANVLDLEFLNQGYHDRPAVGRVEIQKRIDAVPAGKYEGILLGYALCSNILAGLIARDTPLIIPRAHDCITFFLGSRARYQSVFNSRPGTYYYSSGWIECRRRREQELKGGGTLLPAPGSPGAAAVYEQWVAKFGEEQARYLMEAMGEWTQHYTHGVLIDFPFARGLGLDAEVKGICERNGWQFESTEGDLSLLRNWLDGRWDEKDFLVVPPGRSVKASFDEGVIGLADPA